MKLEKLLKELQEASKEFMMSLGFSEDEVSDYLYVRSTKTEEVTDSGMTTFQVIRVCAELSFDELDELSYVLNPILARYDNIAYFEPEVSGILVAWTVL